VKTANHKADNYAVSSTLILLIRLRRKLLPQHLMTENLGQSPSHNVTDQVSLPHKKGKIMALYIGLLMTRLKHKKKFSSRFMKFMKFVIRQQTIAEIHGFRNVLFSSAYLPMDMPRNPVTPHVKHPTAFLIN